MKIVFLIRSLNIGGAERQLTELAKELSKKGHSVSIITFYSGGYFEQELSKWPEIRRKCLNKQGRWDTISFFYRLFQTVQAEQPDILHGYLSSSNILAVCLKPFLTWPSQNQDLPALWQAGVGRKEAQPPIKGGRKAQTRKLSGLRIVWGVRASNMDLARHDWFARLVFRVECVLARFADLVIVNSYAGRDYHIRCGFPSKKLLVIPNGIDTERFSPNPTAGEKVRVEWGIGRQELLIGLVGRLDPAKDHATFLKAAALLAKEHSDVRFVCIGEIPSASHHALLQSSNAPELKERIRWIGPQDDMLVIYNALDLLVSSSSSEGFSNVVGEAMSCGVPCVVTDVGDSARIVSDTGFIVTPNSPPVLAEGIRKCLAANRKVLGENARLRIVNEFSANCLVEETERVFCMKG